MKMCFNFYFVFFIF